MSDLVTLRQIAADERVPDHVVKYQLDRLRIEAARRVGIVRLFDAADADRVKAAIRRNREGGNR